MKRRTLENKLTELGWSFLRHGGKHGVLTNGTELEYILRQKEIHELLLARKIIKRARESGGEE